MVSHLVSVRRVASAEVRREVERIPLPVYAVEEESLDAPLATREGEPVFRRVVCYCLDAAQAERVRVALARA